MVLMVSGKRKKNVEKIHKTPILEKENNPFLGQGGEAFKRSYKFVITSHQKERPKKPQKPEEREERHKEHEKAQTRKKRNFDHFLNA